MKIRIKIIAALTGLALPLTAAPLTESTFTEVVKDVTVVAAATKAATPAQPSEVLKAPDLVRTGPDSRAELTAADQTITRVGANSVFSFEPAGRDLRLEQGSVLFHSPKGKGGGTIHTGGATAAVLGTTIIVVATADGGFKFIVLEGRGLATLPDGTARKLTAGQLVFVLPGGKGFGPVLDINLSRLVAGSQLVNGFSHELASLALIRAAIAKQQTALAKGQATDTGIVADNFFLAPPPAGLGLGGLDHTSYQTAVHPALTPAQFTLLYRPAKGGPVAGGPGGSPTVPLTQPTQ